MILVDTANGASRKVVTPHTTPVVAVALTADGGTAYSAGADGSIVASNPIDGTPTGRLMLPVGVRALAVTAAGSQLAVASDDGVVRVAVP